MGQPFAKPEDEITPDMTLPSFSSNTTKGPSFDNCNNDSSLKQLLIDYIDFKQYGTSIEKRTESIKHKLRNDYQYQYFPLLLLIVYYLHFLYKKKVQY